MCAPLCSVNDSQIILIFLSQSFNTTFLGFLLWSLTVLDSVTVNKADSC